MDIGDNHSTFSRSAVLTAWFNSTLEPLVELRRDREAELTGQKSTVTLRLYRQSPR
jgi:hypothetical protein